MLSMFVNMFKAIFSLLKYPVILILILLSLFIFICSINIIIGLTKGKRFKKGQHKIIKKPTILKRILIDLPKQFIEDLFEKNPEFFKYQGLIIFEGRQGSGKTSSMIKFAMDMQEEYPLAKCTSNLGYIYEDKPLKNWKMLINYKNDIKGVIVVMDELQNWFSSNDSKNFPPEMLGIITQNRKNRRIILGTSQNFYLLAKAIRSQATEVRRCSTLFGCLTIVHRLYPVLDSEGNVQEFKHIGFYFYVHNKKLRNAFNTWKVIENLSNSGFKDIPTNTEIVSNTYIISKGKIK